MKIREKEFRDVAERPAEKIKSKQFSETNKVQPTIVRYPSASCGAGVPESQCDNHDDAGLVVPCVIVVILALNRCIRPGVQSVDGNMATWVRPSDRHRCHVRAKSSAGNAPAPKTQL